MDEEELTIRDYMTKPMIELARHPKYDQQTFNMVANICTVNADDVAEFVRKAERLLGAEDIPWHWRAKTSRRKNRR